MDGEKKWLRDLGKGQVGERVIANFLEGKGFSIKGFNDTKDYDIITNKEGKSVTFEIKTDEYETYKGDTGNMFLEIRCSGKSSGIYASIADYFVYYYPQLESAWIIKLELLKEQIKLRPELQHFTYGCGDGGRVDGILCKRDEMESVGFKVYKIKK